MLSNYFSSTPIDSALDDEETLAVIAFNSNCVPDTDIINCGLHSLHGDIYEIWKVQGERIVHGQSNRCHWRRSDEVLCAAIWLTPEECHNLEQSTDSAYAELLKCLTEQGYPHPFRFWNYIPAINAGDGDDETYKRFCSGRLQAFRSTNLPENRFPAASALGHHENGAVIYVLSSKQAGTHHKNRLQVNAYQYPREYGIHSPSFARATSITLQNQDLFFISGTASIVGHKTMAVGDLSGQLEITAQNIQHLIEHAKKDGCQATLQTIKVYLRHAEDLAACQSFVAAQYPTIPAVFLHADICRDDLLVEIECFFG